MRRNVHELESSHNTRNAVLATTTSKNLELSLVLDELLKVTHNV